MQIKLYSAEQLLAGALLSYQCPEFHVLSHGVNNLVSELELTCHWDGKWSPELTNATCISKWNQIFMLLVCNKNHIILGTSCPPLPEPSADLKLVSSQNSENGTRYGGNVTYSCRDGYRFESDLLLKSFAAICHLNGTWEIPSMLKCVNVLGEFRPIDASCDLKFHFITLFLEKFIG